MESGGDRRHDGLLFRIYQGMVTFAPMGARILERKKVEMDCGIEVLVEVKDSRRLSLRLRSDGFPVLTVPVGCSWSRAMSFLESQEQWIRGRLKVREEHDRLLPPLTPALAREFRMRLPSVFERWQHEMGLRPSAVTVRDMVSRWGSCHPVTKRISISFRLAQYPEECTDYVVVHELAHLRYANHGPEFWALVERYFPEHKKCRAILRGK